MRGSHTSILSHLRSRVVKYAARQCQSVRSRDFRSVAHEEDEFIEYVEQAQTLLKNAQVLTVPIGRAVFRPCGQQTLQQAKRRQQGGARIFASIDRGGTWREHEYAGPDLAPFVAHLRCCLRTFDCIDESGITGLRVVHIHSSCFRCHFLGCRLRSS